ncbi:MAG: hypothetical protein M0005_18160 [Actinomycetota bacterium]|nr:hypothetical protein [Actinomycetota bacterium]
MAGSVAVFAYSLVAIAVATRRAGRLASMATTSGPGNARAMDDVAPTGWNASRSSAPPANTASASGDGSRAAADKDRDNVKC